MMGMTTGGRRARLCLTTALAGVVTTTLAGALGVLPPSAARASDSGQIAQAAATLEFDIPAQPLTSALTAFAQRSGLRLAYEAQLAAGAASPGVKGALTARAALDRLLTGTGLAARFLDGGTVTLDRVATSGDGSLLLAPVSVEGRTPTASSDPARSEGTGAYTVPVMATATKLPLSARETPQSTSVITRQRMDDQGLGSIAEVLASTTGIQVQNLDSDRYVFMARGFSIDTVRYDGVSVPFDSTYQYGMGLSDMAIYDRVEVVRGATGLMTGAGNPSAAINLVRKRPGKEVAGSVTGSIGSWQTGRGEGDLSVPLTADGRVRARVVGAVEEGDSYMDRRHNQKQVAYGVIEADLTPDTLLTVGADYLSHSPRGTSWGGFPLFDSTGKRLDTDVSFNAGTEWSRWDQYAQTSFATAEHRFGSGWKITGAYSLLRSGYDATLGSVGSGTPDPVTGAGTSAWLGKFVGDQVTHSGDVTVSGPYHLFGREHDLMLGANGSWGTVDGPLYTYNWNRYTGVVPNYFAWTGAMAEPRFRQNGTFEQTTDQTGAYAATRLRVLDPLSLIVGSRIGTWETSTKNFDMSGAVTSSSSYDHNGVVTPYVGAVLEVYDGVSLYASYTDIFKPQSERDATGSYLDPITGANYEAGIKADLNGGKATVSAAVFQVKQDNLAQLDPTGVVLPDGSQAYVGAEGATTEGFELEGSGEVLPGWNVYAGYTFAQTEDANGARLNTSTAEHLVRTGTTYRLPAPLQDLTIGANLSWQSGMYADIWAVNRSRRVSQDAYALVGVMGRYELTDDVSVTLNVDNLFDEKYYNNLGFYGTGYYGAPLNATLSLKASF